MNKLIRVNIPLDIIHWSNAKAETVWVEIDGKTYDAYQGRKPGGFYYGILRNDSFFFPKSFCYGARIAFTFSYDGLPTAIISGVLFGFGQAEEG